jgi:hypothetical protein
LPVVQKFCVRRHRQSGLETTSMNETEILQQAKQAIDNGERAVGEHLLYQMIRKNPRSERAWLLLASIVDEPAKKQDCLKQVLAINPSNQIAQQHLAKLTGNPSSEKKETMTSKSGGLSQLVKHGIFFGVQCLFLVISIFTGGFNYKVWSMLDSALLVLSIGITGILPIIDDEFIQRLLFYTALVLYILAVLDMSLNVLISGSVGWGK